MRILLPCGLLALAAVGCGPEVPPPKPLPPPPPPSATEQAAATAEDTNAVLYTYNPVGKRDPFRDTMSNSGAKIAVVDPTFKKNAPLTALQKFEIDQLKLQFTVTGTSSPMGMIIDPNGRGHPVHIGDFVGRNWGKVSHIGREEITVTETIADQQTGRVYPQYIPMRMPKTEQEKRFEEDVGEQAAGGKP